MVEAAQYDYYLDDEEREDLRKKSGEPSIERAMQIAKPSIGTVGLPTPDEYKMMSHMAKTLANSGLLPDHIKSPQAAFAVIQKGRELNLPPMAALSGIYVIGGKPSCSAELMAALIERDYGSTAMIVTETTPERCTISLSKPGWPERKKLSFTIEMAKQAGLLTGRNKHTWASYPEAMLRSRAISFVAKTHFQAAIQGMYVPDELDAQIVMNEAGDITEIIEPPRETRKAPENIQDGQFRDVDLEKELDEAFEAGSGDPFADDQVPEDEPDGESTADRVASRIDAADSLERIAEILNWISKNKAKLGDDHAAIYQLAKGKRDELKNGGDQE